MTMPRDDLTIDELFRDPLTQAVMKADHVDTSKLEAMLRAMASEIGGGAGHSKKIAEAGCAPFDRRAVSRFLRLAGSRQGSCYGAIGSGLRSFRGTP